MKGTSRGTAMFSVWRMGHLLLDIRFSPCYFFVRQSEFLRSRVPFPDAPVIVDETLRGANERLYHRENAFFMRNPRDFVDLR
jgi:hypothetical protein